MPFAGVLLGLLQSEDVPAFPVDWWIVLGVGSMGGAVGGQTRVDLATLVFFPCFIGFFGPLKGAKTGPFGNFFWIGLVAFWGQRPRSTGV